MSRSFWSRAFVLVFVLALVTSPAFAAGSREPAEPAVRGVLSVLWQAFTGLILGPGEGSGSTTLDGWPGNDSGPGMDPNG